MMDGSKARGILLAGVLALTMGACSQSTGAADQTPVDPAPGRYEIALSGKLLGMTGAENGKKPKSMCVLAGHGGTLGNRLAEGFYDLHPGCTKTRNQRDGNKVSGVISCPADPKMAAGMNQFIYDGVVAADSASVEVRINFDATLLEGKMSDAEIKQLKLGMKMFEHARFVIEAKRVGEC